MNDKKTDLRYIKTEKIIRNTFLEMLKEMPYEKIEIKTLAERAYINRKTFYLHYNSLSDLLNSLLEEIYEEIMQNISELEFPRDIAQIIRSIFSAFNSMSDEKWKLIYAAHFYTGLDFEKYIIKYSWNFSADFGTDSLNRDLVLSFFLSGLESIFDFWSKNKNKITFDEVTDRAIILLKAGINGYGEF